MRKIFGAWAFSCVGLVVACSGGPSDEESREAQAASQREAMVLDKCNFHYDCPMTGSSAFAKEVTHRDAGASGVQTMWKSGDETCRAEHLVLFPQGRATYRSNEYGTIALTAITWEMNDDKLEFCEPGGECIACRMLDVPSAPGAAASGGGERCVGASSSCYGRAEGSCGTQRGCYGGSHIRWNGDLEFECKGVSDSCSSMTDPKSCGRQEGCRWE